MSGWKMLSRDMLCETPHLSLSREHVATPTRPAGVKWYVAHRGVAAVVAPRTESGDFLLIRQERVPIRRELWEFPAGQVEGVVTEESIHATALRELGEEAGMAYSGELQSLGIFYSSAGFTDEKCHLFLANEVFPLGEMGRRDDDEAISEVKAFSPAELRRMVADGEIVDANTLATFARLTAKGLI